MSFEETQNDNQPRSPRTVTVKRFTRLNEPLLPKDPVNEM